MPGSDAGTGPDTDVVVIGAGPTGLTTALLLADQGLAVTVLERHPSTGDEPRAISITDESLRILQQVGVLEAAAPQMLQDTGARYYGRRGQLIAEVKPAARRLGHPGKSQFDQPDLEAHLAEALATRTNAEVRFSTEVTALSDTPDGVRLTGVGPDGRASALSARWVIACDGGRSFARGALGIGLEGSTQTEKWIVVDLRNVGLPVEPFAEFHCNGTRPVVVVPGADGRRRYEFMLLPGDDEADVVTPRRIAELVAPFQEIRAGDIRRAVVYVAHQRIAERYRGGHVLLAGDAAHLMPPFAGQGLNAGLRDAANIAWKVAASVRGTGTDALIDSYAAERRPHAHDMVRISHRIGRVVMSTHGAVTALRDWTVAAVRIVPSWSRWLTGMRFLKQPHFTVGCLVPPARELPPIARDAVGRSLPQPDVQTPDGTVAPLDSVLSRGWTLLRVGADGAVEVVAGRDAPSQIVIDTTRALAPLTGFSAFIRPDRYVAAVVTAKNEDAAAAALAAYSSEPGLLLGGAVRSFTA